MAIRFDNHIRSAMKRRKARGLDPRLFLYVDKLRGHAGALAGHPQVFGVDWAPRHHPSSVFEARRVEGVLVFVDSKIASQTDEADVLISSWHLGPLERLTVICPEPPVIADARPKPRKASPSGGSRSMPA
jgi:hypothetical protein